MQTIFTSLAGDFSVSEIYIRFYTSLPELMFLSFFGT